MVPVKMRLGSAIQPSKPDSVKLYTDVLIGGIGADGYVVDSQLPE
jgi:hypothetical protein